MTRPEEILRGLWTFPIVLPDSPLKWLNCYVVKAENGGRNLLVDTGFYHPDCIAALNEGMAALDLRPENTDVFITHMHTDHTGNAAYLQKRGCRILMSEIDYWLQHDGVEKNWQTNAEKMRAAGLPGDVMEQIRATNRAVIYTSGTFSADGVNDGDVLSYGDYNFKAIHTPGHTPGHMCLYDSVSRTLISGDHVLFDISPNICSWTCMSDPLGRYMDSLERIKALPVEHVLPSHRTVQESTLRERADQLLAHHRRRLDDAERVIGEHPGLNAYQIAGMMQWKIRAKDWDDFPPGQKYFAMSETLAHLEHLLLEGRIQKEQAGDEAPVYLIK